MAEGGAVVGGWMERKTETTTYPSLALAPVRPRVRVAPAEAAGEEHGQGVVPARPLRLVQQRLARVESVDPRRAVS